MEGRRTALALPPRRQHRRARLVRIEAAKEQRAHRLGVAVVRCDVERVGLRLVLHSVANYEVALRCSADLVRHDHAQRAKRGDEP